MKANNLRTMKTGDIVTHDFRTAAIFKKAGIDFCCGGENTLEKACADKNLNLEKIESELLEIGKTEADLSLNLPGTFRYPQQKPGFILVLKYTGIQKTHYFHA